MNDDFDAGVPRGFDSTNWLQIRAAAGPDAEAARQALERLLRTYLPALITHVVKKWRIDTHSAEDKVHDFITCKILGTETLSLADPAKGRFRTYVLTILDRFMIDEYRREQRCPTLTDLDVATIGKGDELLFDCVWAQSVIVNALQRMRDECKQKRQLSIWKVFFKRVVAPLVQPGKRPSLAELAIECNLDSPKAASNLVVTAKRKFRLHLVNVVGEYAQHGEAVESELDELCRILGEPNIARNSLSFDAHSSIMNSELWSSVGNATPMTLSNLIRASRPDESDHIECMARELARSARQLVVDYVHRIRIPNIPDLASFGAMTVGDVLSASSVDVAGLDVLKRVFRQRSRDEQQSVAREVCEMLYLAVLATGLIVHGELMSKSPPEKIHRDFVRASKADWVGESIRPLLLNAQRRMAAW